MKKVIMYEIYYFEDTLKRKTFYFEDEIVCKKARFMAYKSYDMDRISKNGFVVPVSQVKKILVKEEDIQNIKIYESESISNIFKEEINEYNSMNILIK